MLVALYAVDSGSIFICLKKKKINENKKIK